MAEQILYVVFHGLIPLVEDATGFHAIVIKMEAHEVLTGHWLTEIRLDTPPGSVLELRGVTPGNDSLPLNQNLIVKKAVDIAAITGASNCLARIDLPKPLKCYSFAIGDATNPPTPGGASLTGADAPTNAKYAGVQVFKYMVPGENFTQTGLFQTDGKNVWKVRGSTLMKVSTDDDIAVLHIYNEPAEDEGPEHSREEFFKGAVLFGVDVGLSGDEKTALPFPGLAGVSQASMPEGLLLAELAPLSKRELKVFELLDPLRAGGLDEIGRGEPVGGGHYCGTLNIN